VYYWFSVIFCDCYCFLGVLERHRCRKCCYQWRTVSGSCVKKDHALTSLLSLWSAVHHLWGVPVLKVCVMSVFTSSKTSGRGTNRVLVHLVCQAEVISITVDTWVRTGVLAFVGWVLLLGRGCRLCVSRLAVLSGGSGRDLNRFLWGGISWVRVFGWSDQHGWNIIRHTNDNWSLSRCKVSSKAPKHCGIPRGLSRSSKRVKWARCVKW